MSVQQIYIYGGRVELLFTVENIPQAVKIDDTNDNENVRCGGPASYPVLEMLDGTRIQAAPAMLDGRAFERTNMAISVSL